MHEFIHEFVYKFLYFFLFAHEILKNPSENTSSCEEQEPSGCIWGDTCLCFPPFFHPSPSQCLYSVGPSVKKNPPTTRR